MIIYPQKKEPWIMPTVSGSQLNFAFFQSDKGEREREREGRVEKERGERGRETRKEKEGRG